MLLSEDGVCWSFRALLHQEYTEYVRIEEKNEVKIHET